MKMYKITLIEKELLKGQPMLDQEKCNPVQDNTGEWFISEVEHNFFNKGVETIFEEIPVEPLFKLEE